MNGQPLDLNSFEDIAAYQQGEGEYVHAEILQGGLTSLSFDVDGAEAEKAPFVEAPELLGKFALFLVDHGKFVKATGMPWF